MKVGIHNLGCKVNSYEVEAMQRILEERGFEIGDFNDICDIYLVNTCSVTNIADRKSRQMLHRARKLNKDAVIVATGCFVQTEDKKKLLKEDVDIFIGNNEKHEIADVIEDYMENRIQTYYVPDIMDAREYAPISADKTGEHTRAYIKIQDGCNQFCSYCIIPFARGRVRSRKEEDVLKEVEALAKKGYKEIVLTGIHLSSYGIEWENNGKDEENIFGTGLINIIEKVAEVEGIERIRLGSLEPRIITEDFAKRLSAIDKICPHFHLSLQSGSDSVLKRMNRHYTANEYLDRCGILRKYFDNPALTTDVIVGFPMETEEEFKETVEFLEKVGFFEIHVFKYSRRRGTKADKMEGQITEAVKSERSDVLLELTKRASEKYRESFFGKELEVLIEENVVIDGKTYAMGHSKEYIMATFANEEAKDLSNTIIKIKLSNV